MLIFRWLVLFLLLGAALQVSAVAQTVLALPTAQGVGSDLRQALALAPGERLRLERLPLGDTKAQVVTADLRRTHGSVPLLEVHSDKGVQVTQPAARAHFVGQLVGDAQSSVFVAIDSEGAMRSVVRRDAEVFVSDMPALGTVQAGAAGLPAQAVRSRQVDPTADAPSKPFACGVDDEFIEAHYVSPSEALLANLRDNLARSGTSGLASQGAQALGALRRADIIIETDYELFQRLGSATAVYSYVTDLMAYVSSQYESEAGARLNVTQIKVYETPADPWNGASTDVLLGELRAYWNDASRFTQPRHHVHLLSARSAGGGIAYVNTLGENSKNDAYGVSANMDGGFSASNPRVVWDAVVIAHEIGHAFGSAHTHSFDAPYVGSSEGGAIDCCYADSRGTQCAARNGGVGRPGVLPGINSITGGVAGAGAGTIMSYCHALSPGMANISFNFGTNHNKGVNAWRVASVLQSGAQTYLPLDSTVQNYALSVAREGTGSGTVTSAPAGINCGSTCSASYAAGTQVTLTAQAASGSSFAGWGGACTGTSSSCSVTMSAARSVTASFNVASNTRLVTLNKAGSGTGSVSSSPSGLACATDCSGASASFSSSAAITLTAQPSSGSVFAGWGGSCTGTGSCTIPAGSSDVNVTASFTLNGGAPRTVTLVKGGDGAGSVSSSPSGLTCSADCNQASATFAGSTTIVLTAQAATGSRFVGWTGACAGTGTCTIAAGSTNVRVTASFNTDSSGGGGPLPDPVQFVTQQYLDFLGRSPDSAGLSHWVSQLNAGSVTRAQLIESFMYSNEFQGRFGPLVRLYTAYFRRVPDYAGLMHWFNAMYPSGGGSGASLADVSQAFAQSAEFVNTYGALNNADFVTLVYQNVLGRTPDAEGFSYWLGQLNAGISRGAMMTGFSESTENQNATANSLLITMSYVGMLRREPDATGYAWWLGEVNAGRLRVLDLINGFLNSQEYARRF